MEIDLIHDVHNKGQTPWDVFRNYLACGTLMECELNFSAVGTLDDEPTDRIPLDLLFASIIDPSFISSLFEAIPPEKITLVQGPANPQPLLNQALNTRVEVEHTAPDEPPLPDLSQPEVVLFEAEKPKPVIEAPKPAGKINIAPSAMPAPAPKETPVMEVESSHKPVVEDTLRVNVTLLETLMNLASEMVLSRNQLQNAIQRGDMGSIKSSSARVSLTTSELQEAIMLTRMQPIGNILSKFPRVVRDLGSARNKEINLEIYGKDVEIDKSLLEGISEPLTHMVRNAVDHGIEDQEERAARGKNRIGKITLRAYHAAGQVVVEISDDGKGIDTQKVAQTALKKGLISEEKLKLMSEAEKRALIFMAGLSTADKVTDVSGRGVGMDVVKTNLDRLGGKMEIETQVGKGTTFRITLPLTLAIIPSLLVSINKEKFAIPQANISELLHVSAAQVKTRVEIIGNAEVLVLRDKLIPLLRLADVLGIETVAVNPVSGETLPERRERISDRRSKYTDPFKEIDEKPLKSLGIDQRGAPDRRYHQSSDLEIVVINTGTLEYGLVVEELHDTFEIVVRPLGQHLNKCSQYTGASVLGDGRVALILDAAGLAASIRLNSLAGSARAAQLQKQNNDAQKNLQTLLLFRNAPEEYCAVPLDMVERIEHIQRNQVESAGSRRTMQFRGQSLPLLSLNDSAQVGQIADTAELVVIVLSMLGRQVGLLAAQPVDVVETALAVDTATHRQPGISGSGIIGKDTTLLVDVFELAATIPGFSMPAPAPAEMPAAAAPAAAQAETAAALPVPTNAATILLVEDSGFFRGQVTRTLEAEGYRVLSAEDGQAGLDLLRLHAEEVRLVVTDIEMPVMNGLDLARRIKADPALMHLPIIALTTLADEKDIAAGKEAGVSDYEIKLDKEKLVQAVKQYLLQ